MKKLLWSLLFAMLLSCDKDEPKKDCGCDSEILNTIPEPANLIGQLGYKIQLDPNDNYYNSKFWVSYTEPNCGNCVHHMIVYNEEMLISFQNLKNPPYENVQVVFAGHLKNVCDKIFAPGDYTYQHIVLTKIEEK